MYSSSKYALDGFSKALRSEMFVHNITVSNVYPSYIRTNISKNAMTGDGTSFGKTDENIAAGMPVEEAVEIILKGMYLNYSTIMVGSFFYKILPKLCNMSQNLADLTGKVAYNKQMKTLSKCKEN